MYHVLGIDHYGSIFAGVRYLDVLYRYGVDTLSTKSNVRSVITDWLRSQSTGNDIIFIYFTSHGRGYHTTYGLEKGRVEYAGDEGNEVNETNIRIANLLPDLDLGPWPLNVLVDEDRDGSKDDRLRDFDNDHYIELDKNDDGVIDGKCDQCIDLDGDGQEDDIFADVGTHDCCDILIDADTNADGLVDQWTSCGEDINNDGYIVGVDFNRNGQKTDWVGIDESLQVKDGWYLDDELASDLGTLSYAKMIFVRQGCPKESKGCFGGGLIDDISASKRIIMTASNETCYSYGDMDNFGQPGYGYSEWSEAFIDALHGQRTHYDGAVIHDSVLVNADWSNDGHVSMWEAWDYAWRNDSARLNGLETPWLDDNFNRLPTYQNEADQLDSSDGLFSMETYFGFDNLKSSDVNDDGNIDMYDVGTIANAFGSKPGDPNWNPLADLNNDNKVNMLDVRTAARYFGKYYSDPPSPVSTKTILYTYPVWTITHKGEAFSVKIFLFNASNIRGWEFKLYWNNAILKCTDAEIRVPDIWSESMFIVGPGVENDFNLTHGRYWIAAVALYPSPSFNGSTLVVTLTFEAKTAGNTILNLQETKLADNKAYPIPHKAIDGLVTVKEP